MSTTVLSTQPSVRTTGERYPGVAAHQLVDGIARIIDLCLILVTGILAYAFRAQSFAIDERSMMALAIAVLLAVNVFSLFKLYDPPRLGSLMYQLPRLLGAWCTTMGGTLVVTFLLATSSDLSRLWIVFWFAAGGLGLGLSRIGLKAWIEGAQRSGELTRNIFVIGTAARGLACSKQLEGPDQSIRVIRRLDIADLVEADAPNKLSMVGVRTLGEALLARRIDHVAIALPPERMALLPSLVRALRYFPVEVGLVPEAPPAGLPVLGVKQVGNVPSVTLLEKPLDGWHYVIKAVEDRILAGTILTFIAPFMLCIGLAVRLTSPGPALFRQKRLGFNQQMVDVFKFRTMYVDHCDKPLSAEVVQATRGDPRVTPVGRFLRRTSLDELPQLVNVLRGEMSLVGPRPHAVAHDRYYAELIDGYLGRHRVKPGITGWAQVNGCRGETRTLHEMHRRVELDLYYIDHWSLLLDLRIILRTLLVGFTHNKAY